MKHFDLSLLCILLLALGGGLLVLVASPWGIGLSIRDHHTTLVIFRVGTWRPYLPTEAEILERLPLTPSQPGEGGTIYTWKDTR